MTLWWAASRGFNWSTCATRRIGTKTLSCKHWQWMNESSSTLSGGRSKSKEIWTPSHRHHYRPRNSKSTCNRGCHPSHGIDQRMNFHPKASQWIKCNSWSTEKLMRLVNSKKKTQSNWSLNFSRKWIKAKQASRMWALPKVSKPSRPLINWNLKSLRWGTSKSNSWAERYKSAIAYKHWAV